MELQVFNSLENSVTVTSLVDFKEYQVLPNVSTIVPYGPLSLHGSVVRPKLPRIAILGGPPCVQGAVFCRSADAFVSSADWFNWETGEVVYNSSPHFPISLWSMVLVVLIVLCSAVLICVVVTMCLVG
jgi:hypothetical protein